MRKFPNRSCYVKKSEVKWNVDNLTTTAKSSQFKSLAATTAEATAEAASIYGSRTMETLKFTANRFQRGSAGGVAQEYTPDFQHPGQQRQESEQHNPQTRADEVGSTILNTSHYKLDYESKALPLLHSGETILSFKVATRSIAIVITDSRVLIYNYKANVDVPFTFEYKYSLNEYNLLPLCIIIENPLNELKPDLVVIDAFTGSMNFFESLKLEPSLSILQNKLEDRILLHNSEFVVDAQSFHESSILVTTSQKRVLHVSFKDQFGDLSPKQIQIYNNRPLISFMLSKSFCAREHNNSTAAISVKSYEVSSVSKEVVILELSGTITVLSFIKGSSVFTQKSRIDIPMGNKDWELDVIDFQLLVESSHLAMLGKNHETDTLQCTIISLNEDQSYIDTSNQRTFPSLCAGADLKHAKLFTLAGDSVFVIIADEKLLIFDPNTNLQKQNSWSEVVAFTHQVKIMTPTKVGGVDRFLYISTDQGILHFELKSPGKSTDNIFFVKEHIYQYINFSKESSPINFSLSFASETVTQSEIRNAIWEVLSELLSSSSNDTNSFNILIGRLLRQKTEAAKKLISYGSLNYNVPDDVATKIELLKTYELLSLAESFYGLIMDNDFTENIELILKDKFQYNGSFNAFILSHLGNILQLISEFCTYTLDQGGDSNLLEIGALYKDMLVESYVKVDDEIRQYLGGLGLSSIFREHFSLVNNVNVITRFIYNKQDGSVELETADRYNEILLGLACFLYYTTNETTAYLKNYRPTDKTTLDNFDKLLLADREKWVHIFIVLKKQSDILPLVNKYSDLDSLSSILESKRELIENLLENQEISDIEFTAMMTDLELELDGYVNYYGDSFTEALFEYYIHHNKINLLFTWLERYSDYLEKFLSTKRGYYGFSWIGDVKASKFNVSCQKMQTLLMRSAGSLHERRIENSIGKLSSLCHSKNVEGTQCFSSDLELIKIQTVLKLKLDELFRNEGLVLDSDSDYVATHGLEVLRQEVKQSIARIASEEALNITELINVISLSSFKPKVLASAGDSNMLEMGNCTEKDGEVIQEEFFATIFIKVIELINFYESFSQMGFVTERKHNLYTNRRVWMKLLFRRLMLRKNWDSIFSSVIADFETREISVNIQKSDLVISDMELRSIGVHEDDLVTDYEKENALLKNGLVPFV